MNTNQDYNQLIYQLQELIDMEKEDNKSQKGIVNDISDNILEISLEKPCSVSGNQIIEVNRVKSKVIRINNKNLLVKLDNKNIFRKNQEVSIHNIQKDIIIKKLNGLKLDIEDNKINNSNKKSLNALLYHINPKFSNKRYDIKNLNNNQKIAVEKSLRADKFHIIQGPPGTGKTHTIIKIIQYLYNNGQKILITTHTHIALDNILEKLDMISSNDILRIGNISKVSKASKKYILDEHIKKDPLYEEIIKRIKKIEDLENSDEVLENTPYDFYEESYLSRIFRRITGIKNNENTIKENIKNMNSIKNIDSINELNEEIDKIKEKIQSNLLKNIPIIASTVLSSSSYLTKDMEFDYMIMDEASQVPIYLALIPLMKTDKFILIGDHKQLQPIENNNASLFLNKSIFNYLIKKYPDNFTFLNIQYRMNKEISDIASNLYYSGNLQTYDKISNQRIKVDNKYILLNNNPITFIDTSAMDYHETSLSSGCCNKYEAKIILSICKSLLKNNIKKEEIGIITPYRKQKLYIKKLLNKEDIDIETDTIYRFQGREKDVIIMNFCKSFHGRLTKFQEKFLSDKNQLNVSITRSRKKLIMIGDISLLSKSENIKELLEYISPINTIYLKDFIQ